MKSTTTTRDRKNVRSTKKSKTVDVTVEHRAAAITESEFDFIMSEMDRIANSKS